MGKLLDMTNEAIDQKRGEIWPCRICQQRLIIEGIAWSVDGSRVLTFYRCEPCNTFGVTPDTIRRPPTRLLSTIHPKPNYQSTPAPRQEQNAIFREEF